MLTNPVRWLRDNGHNVGMLTGQDRRAIEAVAACWELYAVGDDDGRGAAVRAATNLLNGMQRKCWPMARDLIARSLDWSDRERLWTELVAGGLYARGEGLRSHV